MRNINIKYPNKLKELRTQHSLKQKDISRYLAFTGEERISRWDQGQTLLGTCKMHGVEPIEWPKCFANHSRRSHQ